MKKNLFTVAAVALVAFVSCNKETNSPVQPAPVSDIKFEAEMVQTKTAIGDADDEGNRAVTWVLGDQVNINGTLFTANGIKEDGKAIFETDNLDFATAEQYDAVYPATAGTSLEAVTIAAKQDGTFASAGVAVAQSENRSLAFMNVASIIKFQVPAAYASVTVESTANLAGTVSVTFDEDGTPVIGDVTNASKVITLENVKAGVDYYVAILPGNHKFTFNIDGRLSKEASNPLTATRAGILALGVLPKPAKLDRNLAFSAATATATVGEAFTAPTLSGVKDGVTYKSSNTAVATVDTSTGAVTLVAAGETTITASAEATEVYNAGSVSYTLTVNLKESDYALIGTHNNWSFSDLTPLYIDGNNFVASGLKGLDEFKIVNKSATKWEEATTNKGCNTTMKTSGISYLVLNHNASNIKVASSAQLYDIEVNKDLSLITIKESNLTVKASQFSVVGSNDNWDSDIVFLSTSTTNVYVAKNIYFKKDVGVKFRQDRGWANNWSCDWKALNVNTTMVCQKGYDCNILFADGSSNWDKEYDVYLQLSNGNPSKFKVVTAGSAAPTF